MLTGKLSLLLWVLLSFSPGLFGRLYKPGAWYAALPKPPWTPPNVAFPIVWTFLYFTIGVAAWMVFRNGFADRRAALASFLVHLALNGLWSWIFFGQHQIAWALAEIAVLWLVSLAMMVSFWKTAPLAGALLAPYLVWLSIALALNASIYIRSKG